jgi:hypothetical protein
LRQAPQPDSSDTIFRWHGPVSELTPGYRPFDRPNTAINRFVDGVLSVRRPVRVELDDVARWRARSIESIRRLGGADDALGRVVSRARWVISDQRAPVDCWCGEIVMRGADTPFVILYEDGAWTRLPSRVFEMAAQTGVDHMVGHLYPYFSGAPDYGEEVACRYQFALPLRRRGLSSKVTALLVPLLHRFHKQIPFRNYTRAALSRLR